MEKQPMIGLEVHVELKTQSKMFCDSANDPLERHANVNVCPICLGHPGTLPVINERAIAMVIKTGLALGSKIAEFSKFDRKNYFYPDLPKGYQISQYDMPLCLGGELNNIRIRRVHLEEDTGRLVHEKDLPADRQGYSLVDFNRAGVPLMELVTEPDITSAKQAREFSEELQLILRYIGVSDADMEKGQMRVEANISLKGGNKVEVKNLNSFRAVEKAIEYEIERQAKAKKVILETRGWDDAKGITFSQRLKEEAHDYRYFPEPDLPPLSFTQDQIRQIEAEIPELPFQKRVRFQKEYGLNNQAIEVFVKNKDLSGFFEQVVSEFEPNLSAPELKSLISTAANYILTDLQGLLKETSTVTDKNFQITPENFAEFIQMIQHGALSSKLAKEVLSEMFARGGDPNHIVEEKGLVQITDKGELENIVKEVISQNLQAAQDFKNGKTNVLQFLVGQVMAKTRGKASPDLARQLLTDLIKHAII